MMTKTRKAKNSGEERRSRNGVPALFLLEPETQKPEWKCQKSKQRLWWVGVYLFWAAASSFTLRDLGSYDITILPNLLADF